MLAVLGFRSLDTEGDAENPACLTAEKGGKRVGWFLNTFTMNKNKKAVIEQFNKNLVDRVSLNNISGGLPVVTECPVFGCDDVSHCLPMGDCRQGRFYVCRANSGPFSFVACTSFYI